jgi:hypothetical protein
MRIIKILLLLWIALSFVLTGCRTDPSTHSASTAEPIAAGKTDPSTVPSRTTEPIPVGKTIVVTSAEDDGPGTVRQALRDASAGDTIKFDTAVFPTDQPNVIYLRTTLKMVWDYLTIDASDAGVILDGSEAYGAADGIEIVSNFSTVSGLLVRNINGAAIRVRSGHDALIEGNVLGSCDIGIGLSGTASNNTITGNYIGVLADGVTPLGTRTAGIVVAEGAHDNQIGPNNAVAFSDQWGIAFDDLDAGATGNTISENSIHDNGSRGISLNGGNDSLDGPVLLDFDLKAGTVAGAASAGCTVEVFSDSGNEGAIYEGQAVADEKGMFAYDNGTGFSGPFLTATATDADGNTSEFSPHTFGRRRSLTLQEGNGEPVAPMVRQPYEELADNRISNFNVVDRWYPGGRLTEVEQLGTRWMRLSLDNMEWEWAVRDDWYSQSEINDIQDKAISSLADSGTTIVYVLVHWDEKLHSERAPNYGNEQEIQLFLDYARLIVSHYRGRIQYYEILNEPVAYVEVADYVNLIHRMIPVIHEADPDAKIVVGGATGLSQEWSRDYLFDVLQSDVMPLVDGVTFHPFYGESPQYDETRDYYYAYRSLVQEIKDTATAHGFRGEYLAAEMQWRTPDIPHPVDLRRYTDIVASKYYARAIVMNLGLDVTAGITAEILEIPVNRETVRNLGSVMAGARVMDLPITVQSEYSDIESYSFSLPNGEALIALWTDGVAVDDDPGVKSSLVLQGCTGRTATGIDVLYGFEQGLASGKENGDLVIDGFLLKDYPIFIRLSE